MKTHVLMQSDLYEEVQMNMFSIIRQMIIINGVADSLFVDFKKVLLK